MPKLVLFQLEEILQRKKLILKFLSIFSASLLEVIVSFFFQTFVLVALLKFSIIPLNLSIELIKESALLKTVILFSFVNNIVCKPTAFGRYNILFVIIPNHYAFFGF